MKSIRETLKSSLPMSISKPIESVSNDDIASFVNAVFEQLKSIFPAWSTAWKNQEEIDTARKIWIRSFIENGITTKRQVSIGLKACRKLETAFLPSVGKFINLCKPTPENLGLPSLEVAFNKALSGGVLHPVIEATVKLVGSYDIRVGVPTDKSLLKRFEYYYMIVVNRYANNEHLLNPVNNAICNGTEDNKGLNLDKVNLNAENIINKRISEQGISRDSKEARRQALSMLGLKDRKNKKEVKGI